MNMAQTRDLDALRPPSSGKPVLEVENLVVSVMTPSGPRVAVDRVSFTVAEGEALGLVGESGSGKSLTLRAVMGLLPAGAQVTSGRIVYRGQDVSKMTGKRLNALRGAGMAMVFQEPMTALNPVMRVGWQIVDGAMRHHGWSRAQARTRAVELMSTMGIPDPAARFEAYPHELSGGMRQRVMIAAALSASPALLLCDEPTTALDVTIQDQIIGLLADLRERLGTGLLYVTHDLAVVAQLCDRVEVMYSGQLVESGTVRMVFDTPRHPYSLGLLRATPQIDAARVKLVAIPGLAPSLDDRPSGCPFSPRCSFVDDQCRRPGRIPLRAVGEGHRSRCVRPEVCAIDAFRAGETR